MCKYWKYSYLGGGDDPKKNMCHACPPNTNDRCEVIVKVKKVKKK